LPIGSDANLLPGVQFAPFLTFRLFDLHDSPSMKRPVTLACIAVAFFGFQSVAQNSSSGTTPTRPKILGVARIDLRTDNLAAARQFYSGVLGLPGAATSGSTTFEVNPRQFVRLTEDLRDPKRDRLIRIAFETSDAEQLRQYLAAHGVKVPAQVDRVSGYATAVRSFRVTDPEGYEIEFVESLPIRDTLFAPAASSPVSDHMIHVGFVVHDRAAEDRFYKDILGFHSVWYGGMKDDQTDWVDMQVPDGTDWLEYMLNVHDPDPRTLGVMHHLALGVPSVAKGFDTITARGYKGEKPQIGRDGKWQLNLYDPNFTRVELMEPKPVQKPCCSPMKN
jgi:catechol 2,3-dioxygenase-like lactoylglutathione lyase family enzyme